MGIKYDINQNEKPYIQQAGIKEISSVHREMARLKMDGCSNNEIAVITDKSPERVSQVTNSPLFKNLLQTYEEKKDQELSQAREALIGLSNKAVGILGSILKNGSEKNQLVAAKDVLDRVGLVTKEPTKNLHLTLSAKDILNEMSYEDLKGIEELRNSITPTNN